MRPGHSGIFVFRQGVKNNSFDPLPNVLTDY